MSIKRFDFQKIREKANKLRKLAEATRMFLPEDQIVTNSDFGPLIGTICDEDIRAEYAWMFPLWLKSKLGSLEISVLTNVNFEQLLNEYLSDKWPKNWNSRKKENYLKEISKRLSKAMRFFNEIGRTPVTIFDNRSYEALEVYFTLRRIPGIGAKKANMITRDFIYSSKGLHTCEWFARIKKIYPNFRVERENLLDMPIDHHVIKVFLRIFGIKYPPKGKKWKELLPIYFQDIIAFSKLVFPEFPARLDELFWTIGREYCDEFDPNCSDCLIKEICEIGRSRDG